ncbi:MAG: group II intron maturase-specific domain-containing protein [Sodalis sp. (in: enterobacteria)]
MYVSSYKARANLLRSIKNQIRSLTTGNGKKLVKATINELNTVLLGWISYCRHS